MILASKWQCGAIRYRFVIIIIIMLGWVSIQTALLQVCAVVCVVMCTLVRLVVTRCGYAM